MTLDRRQLLAAAALALPAASALAAEPPPLTDRPPPPQRRFTSPAVERAIAQVRRTLGTQGKPGKLATMFERCLPNTLDTTVETGTLDGRPDTFVITGDIPAMWLRDSAAQLWPYLPFVREDPGLARLIAGAIHRQTRCILIDPYANAFNKTATGSRWNSDKTAMRPELHERKYELDSLCWPLRLAHGYWRATGDLSPFDARWVEAARLTLATMRVQQRRDGQGPYSFRRSTNNPVDTAAGDGSGNIVNPVGMIASVFRPSDDATILSFLVPSNLFAVVSLGQMASIAEAIHQPALAADARALAAEVKAALAAHATADHPRHGRIWAYEVDGFGGRVLMDDANAPSLASLAYLGVPDDAVARASRAFALSTDNPWYARGRLGEGQTSPHTGPGQIWPLAICLRALTAADDTEVLAQLRLLIATDAGTGFMHESFDANDPAKFTRPWFAWANGVFGELVWGLHRSKPALLQAA